MTPDEQLQKWVEGESIHNTDRWVNTVDSDGRVVGRYKLKGGECCPDFSCCEPDLKWDKEMRIQFANANYDDKQVMLFSALKALVSKQSTKVHIAGAPQCQS